jgi:hypothetical protein
MLKPRILVTGATGKTGSVVVAELLRAGYRVRAMVRRQDARSAQLRAQGAEIAVADMSDVDHVAEALKDVQRAYYCPPFDPYMIQGAVAFAVAARESGLEHIVGLTQWLSSPSHPALMTRQHWLVDRLLSMTSGITHTILRPGFFADNYLALTRPAAHLGVFPWPYGDSRNAPPFKRGHRTGRGLGADQSVGARREELPAHRASAPGRAGDGGRDRARRGPVRESCADAHVDVPEGDADGRLPERSDERHAVLHRRSQARHVRDWRTHD